MAAVVAGLVWAPPAGAGESRDQTVLDGVVKRDAQTDGHLGRRDFDTQA